MITVRVDSIWRGQVAIRDKYVEQCRKEKADLAIEHKGEQMIVPFANLEKKIRGRSDRKFKDRFSRASHYLYYFWWVPKSEDVPQTASLFA